MGVHCSHSPSLLVNVTRTPRKGKGRLVRSRPPPEPTGQGSPPSGFSRTGRARRLRAVPTARRGSMASSAMDDVMGSMATVSRRARDDRPVRGTVATSAPGFGGGRMYCSHVPSHRGYVGANFEGVLVGRLLGVGRSGGRMLGFGPRQGRLRALLPSGTQPFRPAGHPKAVPCF